MWTFSGCHGPPRPPVSPSTPVPEARNILVIDDGLVKPSHPTTGVVSHISSIQGDNWQKLYFETIFFVGGGPEPSLSKLTYFPDKACLKMTFPFPKVGYVIVFWRVYRNIINYPKRGELLRKNWWIWACSQMKSTCGTCGFPHGSKSFFFNLWGEIKSLANHLNLPHHVIFFFRRNDASGLPPICIISGRSSCPRQLRHFIPNFSWQQMKSNGSSS